MRAELVSKLNEVDKFQWDQLNTTNHPFTSYDFLNSLELSNSVCSKTGWQPMHIIIKDANDNIIGACPNYLKMHSYGEYVFDWAWADAFQRNGLNYYPKLLCAVPFTPLTGQRILANDETIKKQMLNGLEAILKNNHLSSCHILFLNKNDHLLFKEQGWMTRKGVQFKWKNNLRKKYALRIRTQASGFAGWTLNQ